MSRKWERMIEKNRKEANARRQKSGHNSIGTVSENLKIKGRSWIFPLILIFIGTLFGFTSVASSTSDLLSQITVGLYLLLAIFHYFIRRPYVVIGKQQLSWRTYTGEKKVEAVTIESIIVTKTQAIVKLNDGKTKKSFNKLYQLYPIADLSAALKQFATFNKIELLDMTKE